MLLEDVASSDHHPGCLYPVERSALLLLHQDLIKKTNKLKGKGQLAEDTSERGDACGLDPTLEDEGFPFSQISCTHALKYSGISRRRTKKVKAKRN